MNQREIENGGHGLLVIKQSENHRHYITLHECDRLLLLDLNMLV